MGSRQLVTKIKFKIMRLFILIVLGLFFASCSTINKTSRVTFKYYNKGSHKLIMKVPSEFNFIKISTGGEGEEHRYWYKDSALIYVSDAKGNTSFNESLIRIQDGAYTRKFLSDSIILKGIDGKGNYWQELKYKGIILGYFNISADKKALYDSVFLSIRYR